MIENRFRVSPERYQAALKEISENSEPEGRFYIMVAVSTLIACFGLITNSTAVIIGAMLVAPLMTPIFGIALSLIRSDAKLFGRAIRAEIAGVAAAILMGVIVGLLYPALEPTPEMIARTEPQLFDLLVAVFSGFAGAYALMDEKISPALPGVAIATAIVPPLANAGLCFSIGQFIAGFGSFLLFFANFLSILLVASAAFWIFGMAGVFNQLDKKTLYRRFSLPVICFISVAIFLTHTLISIAQHHYLNETIETTLENELLMFPDTTFDGARYDEQHDGIYVMADIHSSRTFTPKQVSRLQASLRKEIEKPIYLIVRSKMAHEITAIGSNLKLGKQQLDGAFSSKSLSPQVLNAKIADTAIRNYLSEYIGYELDNVRVINTGNIMTIVAAIYGVSPPIPEKIKEMEQAIQKELGQPDLRLLVSFIETRLYDRTGSVRLEFSAVHPLEQDQQLAAEKSIDAIKKELSTTPNIAINGISNTYIDGVIFVLLELSGPSVLTPEDVQRMEQQATDAAKIPVRLFASMTAETVVTSTGYEQYSTVAGNTSKKNLEASKDAIEHIIETSNM